MRCLLHLFAIAVSAICLCAQDAPAPTAAELFAWFDRLGFEDCSKAKFARIWTGKWTETGEENRLEQDVSDGFVLEDHGETFRAVLADLSVTVLKKNGADPKERDFCGYRELSLKPGAERVLASLSDPKVRANLGEPRTWWTEFDQMEKPAQYFVLARECHRRGLNDLASQLVGALATLPANGPELDRPFPV